MVNIHKEWPNRGIVYAHIANTEQNMYITESGQSNFILAIHFDMLISQLGVLIWACKLTLCKVHSFSEVSLKLLYRKISLSKK